MYPKDTEKWKQFTTIVSWNHLPSQLFCIPKILKNESNSQHKLRSPSKFSSCFVSQRYWKMKAIHNLRLQQEYREKVVLYPKDTEKWKQFTTKDADGNIVPSLFCIPKILKNESNSQLPKREIFCWKCCFVSQRYWKMKAIHNFNKGWSKVISVVLYPKDTEKWKQFTTPLPIIVHTWLLFCIPKILKNESNSQLISGGYNTSISCFVSQRYWKMKAIHNRKRKMQFHKRVVLYPKDTEKWKQFTTGIMS